MCHLTSLLRAKLAFLLICSFPQILSLMSSSWKETTSIRSPRMKPSHGHWKRSTSELSQHNHYATHDSQPNFSYEYGVADDFTGDMKQVYETRHGQLVRGSYRFLQPDGILRVVTYSSDPLHGFQAKVQMLNGYAFHPISSRMAAEVY